MNELTASGLAAAALCPGKVRLERGLAESASEYAARGTYLHRYFRTSLDHAALSRNDRELMDAAEALAEQFLATFREAVGLTEDDVAVEEHEVALDGIVPGHPDNVLSYRGGKIVAIIDLKTGVIEQEEAPSNLQLACYAALVWQRKPFDRCGVCIVSPAAFGPRVSIAMYEAHHMPAVLAEIQLIKDATLHPDAPLVAGEVQCQFCRAVPICPAYRAKYMTLEKLSFALAIELVSNADLEAGAAVITACRGKRGAEWMDELKRRVEAGMLPGWKLQSTGDQTHLDNTIGLYNAITDYFGVFNPGFTATSYDACRTMTWQKLESLIQELTGLSDKKAQDFVKTISEPFVTRTPKARRVVRDKLALPANPGI